MTKKFYITTPIYYVNASPHLGHAYTSIVADTMTRAYRLLGYDTYFLTGTDEHGDKLYRAAQERGIEPQAFVDEMTAKFRDLLPKLEITNDDFIHTTEERHKKVVRQVLQTIYDKGEIYKESYSGLYCTGCERFYTEKELVDGKCPDHLTKPELIEEVNYFFKMSAYQDWLIERLENEPELVRPEQYRKEILSFLKEPLRDLCISRPKSRLQWGIPLPFDDEYVTYVWFDALLNYISGLGYPDDPKFAKYWPVSNHTIAKDILKTHAIYWPCMLKAAGIETFAHLNCHGFWTTETGKMSKSHGTVVKPLELTEKYGVDAFRYFLIREMPFGKDATFSEVAFIERTNSDLANDLGNLLSRVVGMINKYLDGIMPAPGETTEAETELFDLADGAINKFEDNLKNLKFHLTVEDTLLFIRATNKYIDTMAPWQLAKEGETAKLGTVLNTSARMVERAAIIFSPIMPSKCLELLERLGINEAPAGLDDFKVKAGTPVVMGDPVFPRQERLKEEEPGKLPEKGEEIKKEPGKPTITYDDFQKLDFRIAQIITAERVPKTDKLVHLKITIGTEERMIVAGIAEHYAADDLVGKKIMVLANLEPRKIRGLVSHGMLLAAKDGKDLVLMAPDGDIPTNAEVS